MTPILPLRVVCAIIEDREGRVLLAQRPVHKHLGSKWEFAGGKVEPGELPRLALRREIKEELGCDIEVEHPLPPFIHDYGTVVIEMLPDVLVYRRWHKSNISRTSRQTLVEVVKASLDRRRQGSQEIVKTYSLPAGTKTE